MASIQYYCDSISLDYYSKKPNSNNSVLHQVFDIQMEPDALLTQINEAKIKRKYIDQTRSHPVVQYFYNMVFVPVIPDLYHQYIEIVICTIRQYLKGPHNIMIVLETQ